MLTRPKVLCWHLCGRVKKMVTTVEPTHVSSLWSGAIACAHLERIRRHRRGRWAGPSGAGAEAGPCPTGEAVVLQTPPLHPDWKHLLKGEGAAAE